MNKVLFIGIDAAEPTLLQQWMNDGSLPNLKALADRGCQRLVGHPHGVVLHPWSNFYTGRNPGAHGLYHYIGWNPAGMRSERASIQDAGLEPFWRRLPDRDLQVIALDMPMMHSPKSTTAIEVHGWATHEIGEPFFTCPPELKRELTSALGPNMKVSERYGLHSAKEVLAIRDELLAMIAHSARLIDFMLENYEWDLFLVALMSLHLGGHKLWGLTGIEGEISPQNEQALRTALKEVYIAADDMIGRIAGKVPEGTAILVSSFHGMTASTSRIPILPEMVSAIVRKETESRKVSQQPGMLARFRDLIPLAFRHRVKRQLPIQLQDKLTTFWRQGGIDWSRTPVFALVSDFDGYVQVNLKGRERDGIVATGAEYEEWISKVSEGLSSFRDQDSGKPVVARILHREELGLDGPRKERFPDLVIQWSEYPAAEHRVVVSERYGQVPWPTPGRNPDGRSGNHLPNGLLICSLKPDPGLAATAGEITIQDVTATIHHLLGQPVADGMIGRRVV